jgi:hypothetical protein
MSKADESNAPTKAAPSPSLKASPLRKLSEETRVKLMAKEVPAHLRALLSVASDLPPTQIRRALSAEHISTPGKVKSEDTARYLTAVIEGQLLAEERGTALVLDGTEYSNKSVYPFKTEKAAIDGFQKPVDATVVQTASDALQRHARRHDGYRYYSDDGRRLKVVASEKHRYSRVDDSGEAVIDLKRRTIVIEADRSTGVVFVAIDRTSGRSTHGSANRYVQHYLSDLGARLQSAPVPFNLRKAVAALRQSKGLVRFTHMQHERPDGGYSSMTPPDGIDVRDYDGFESMQALSAGEPVSEIVWLAGTNPDGPPRGEIWTTLYADNAEVRFEREATATEVHYVIDQLRSRA